MRTIKFRAKAKGSPLIQDGTFVYGNLVLRNENMPVIDIYGYVDGYGVHYEHTIDKDTIGQFTGLYDKNGKEIYEGDIVKFTKLDGKLVTGFVKWDDCNPCMCIEFKTEYKQTDWEYDFIKCGTMIIEVIGNIHDNPELMEGC